MKNNLLVILLLLVISLVLLLSTKEVSSNEYRGCLASANQAAHKFPDTFEQNLKACDTLRK